MARHLEGGRQATDLAALAAAIGGVAFSAGTLFQYVSFDYLWWVAAAYFMVRLLASDDPPGVSLSGMRSVGNADELHHDLSGFWIAVAFSSRRRGASPEPVLWCGIALAFVIFLPTSFGRSGITGLLGLLEERSRSRHPHGTKPIHLCLTSSGSRRTLPRPIVAGRPSICSSTHDGKRIAFCLDVHCPFRAVRDRKRSRYYMAPAYPMLLAAGAVWGERWVLR